MDKKKRYIQFILFALLFTGLLFALKREGQQELTAPDRGSYAQGAITEREHLIDMPRSEQVKAGMKENTLERSSSASSKARKGAGAFLLFGLVIGMGIAAFRGRSRSSLLSFLILCMTLADVYLCQIRLIHESDGKKRAVAAR